MTGPSLRDKGHISYFEDCYELLVQVISFSFMLREFMNKKWKTKTNKRQY